jgi:hypothetical protein
VIDAGLSYSETFRRLVTTLNHSDVIVYIEPKLTREDLGGFLVHNVAFQEVQRYLRILVDPRGAPGRVVPILAHDTPLKSQGRRTHAMLKALNESSVA